MAPQNLARTSIAFALIILSSHAFAVEEAIIRGDAPEISFRHQRHDFGTVYRGQTLRHAFGITNTGKAALDIRSTHAGCGCINAQVKPSTRLIPGESGELSFDFDTSWFSGPITRAITVDSNDPDHATTTLEVSANIKEEIKTSPALISIGEVDKNSPKPATLFVQILSKAPGAETFLPENKLSIIPAEFERIKGTLAQKNTSTQILAVTASSPHIVLTTEPAAGGMRIHVSFKSPLPAGPFRERITIWNTSTHMKELVVPVVGEVVPRTRLSNTYIEFGAITPGKRSRREIIFRSRVPDFRIESIEVDIKRTEALKNTKADDVISTSVVSGTNTIDVTLKTPPKIQFYGPSINISGTLLVKTNDPDAKEFRIPFFGVFTEENSQ